MFDLTRSRRRAHPAVRRNGGTDSATREMIERATVATGAAEGEEGQLDRETAGARGSR
jgi:hypothetical protein